MEEVQGLKFVSYLKESVGEDAAMKVMEALGEVPSVSVRTNPFKLPKYGYDILNEEYSKVQWNDLGYILSERPLFTLDPEFHSGAYYVQDSSAMFVGYTFRQVLKQIHKKGNKIRVLDLCAAPGGKTTDIAASLRLECGDEYILVANEVMKNRASILCENIAVWGDPNVVVTSVDPAAFAALPGYFDIIIADVPCSGEGMFRKDEDAVNQWTTEMVSVNAARQKRIVSDVWQALSSEGIFIYSTCTFNKYENDMNVSWIAEKCGAEVMKIEFNFDGPIHTKYGVSLLPGLVPGEGQYCAVLKKTGESVCLKPKKEKNVRLKENYGHLKDFFNYPVTIEEKGDILTAIPNVVSVEKGFINILRPLMSGTALGTIKGKNFVPHPDLAYSIILSDSAFTRVEIDKPTALKFLHKDAIILTDKPLGLLLICHNNIPLGFIKNLGNRTNNLLPLQRRIRMDII